MYICVCARVFYHYIIIILNGEMMVSEKDIEFTSSVRRENLSTMG